MSEVEFLKRWIKTLECICGTEVRAKVNGASIALTSHYVGIDRDGVVEVCEVDKDTHKYQERHMKPTPTESQDLGATKGDEK